MEILAWYSAVVASIVFFLGLIDAFSNQITGLEAIIVTVLIPVIGYLWISVFERRKF